MSEPTDIISRMEAMQKRFGNPTDAETLRVLQFALNPSVESEQDYNQRMDEREQDRYDMKEAE